MNIKEIELIKLSLQPDETLLVNIQDSDEELDQSVVQAFRKNLCHHLKTDNVIIICGKFDISFTKIKTEALNERDDQTVLLP